MLTLGKFSLFSLTILMFNYVALKTQFTLKWTGSDIVRENFSITQAQWVKGNNNSPEQSSWPRPWEVTSHSQNEILFHHFSWQNTSKLTNISPFKEDWYPVYFWWHGSDRLLKRIIITHHRLCLCDWENVCDLYIQICFQRCLKSLSENPEKCSSWNNNRSFVFLWCLWCQSIRKKLRQHAKQMSLYNFIILRKKETPTQVLSCGIGEAFKNSGGCFWKHVTYYYITKNYIGHKSAIFNAILLLLLLLLLHLLLNRWWDMRLEHDVARLYEDRADSRNMCLKQKKVLLMLYYIDKNW